jgi:alcohol dehydrogenase (cytochrome c)
VLFTGGSAGFTALNATTGDFLWASRLPGPVSNGPITYELDGLQYVVVAAGNSLAAFVLNK